MFIILTVVGALLYFGCSLLSWRLMVGIHNTKFATLSCSYLEIFLIASLCLFGPASLISIWIQNSCFWKNQSWFLDNTPRKIRQRKLLKLLES